MHAHKLTKPNQQKSKTRRKIILLVSNFQISMDFLSYSLLIFSIAWIFNLMIQTSNARARNSPKLPPGPSGPPIIGNILHLGPKPHRSLTELARKHGPVIMLKLGRITTVVVSSPETAKIVLQKHDSSFSGRTVPAAAEALNHNEFSIPWLPPGNRWRKLRRILKEQMLSASRLESGQGLRMEMLQKLSDYVRGCCEAGRAVDVGEAAFTTSLNLISSTIFSMELAPLDSGSSQEMKELVWNVMKCAGSPNLADYFPLMKYVDPQGISKKSTVYFEKMFAIFDEIIDQRLELRSEKDDMVQALIDLNRRDEAEFSRNDINHLLLDLFIGGTDTTSGTVEWAMTELIRHPVKMSKVRQEVSDLIKVRNGQQIQESDISTLQYLQAIVKETLRLHPAGPFLIPHKAESDVEVNGYVIPKDAQVLVNAWAIGRDPNVWPNADVFEPERFLTDGLDHVDYRGKDFELIPFGSGRRLCPGLPLAHRMMHLMLATLVGNFEWGMEGMTRPEEISMDDKFGLSLHKAITLKALPKKAM